MTVSKTAKQIGVIGATGVVAGNMMGTGIALLPSSLASIGSITIISWIVTTIGALALAYGFSVLGNKDPQEGGPVAYSSELSPALGYQSGLLYFHAGWVGNLAMALAGVDYLSVFFPSLTQPLYGGIATIVVIWLLSFVNLLGSAWMSRLITIAIVGILTPVVLTGTIGWFTFDPATFSANWHVQAHVSSSSAVLSGVILCIWAFLGVESASVNAGLVKNPRRTIPMATMLGTAIAALVYIASSTAISGMFPASEVAASGAPFSLALSHIFDSLAPAGISVATEQTISVWIGYVVSALTAFACLISLGTWIMMIAQAASRSAKDGVLPKVFSEVNEKNIPVKGIFIQATLSTVLMAVVSLIGIISNKNSQDMFGMIASVTVLFSVFPYFYSMIQWIKIERMTAKTVKQAIFPIVMAVVAIAWCFTALTGASFAILVTAILLINGMFILYAGKDRTQLEKNMAELRNHASTASH
ncbi:amino acid permease [Vibrio sp. S4M6]|uniref:amino acid permease n=1 Tax=Vibrio sinus TaxID=2946865 RepID=UPI00202A6A27|nr:amino acid permease [Vibrio sinus]MCL9779963.1 amino acid permease [Vibrio sinus]